MGHLFKGRLGVAGADPLQPAVHQRRGPESYQDHRVTLPRQILCTGGNFDLKSVELLCERAVIL